MGYFVPNLGTNLISIKQHIKYQGCYFHAESDEAVLAFPSTIININIYPEMHIQIQPAKHSNAPYAFDITTSAPCTPQKHRTYRVIPTSHKSFIPKAEYSKFISKVKVKKLIPEAKLPKRATQGSAGFDVRSSHKVALPPHSTTKVNTSLSMEIQSGMYLRIASRSSLALKRTNVGAGVIDNDYRGEVVVLLQNSADKEYIIPFQSRIAQFIFEQNTIPCIAVSKTLTQTSRGKGGFRSSNQLSHVNFINRIKAKDEMFKEQTLRNNLNSHKLDEDPETKESDQLLPRVPKLPPEIRNTWHHYQQLHQRFYQKIVSTIPCRKLLGSAKIS